LFNWGIYFLWGKKKKKKKKAVSEWDAKSSKDNQIKEKL
jgi:hypothetical protein